MKFDDVVDNQRNHWKRLSEEHSGTVGAVGSESVAHKHLRYEKIVDLFGNARDFTVHDIGPGIGDLCEYLQRRCPGRGIEYSASEITGEYCDIARKRFPGISFLNRNILAQPVTDTFDFVVMSGVFHQRGDISHSQWQDYMDELIIRAFAMAKKGLAFNVLSSYADFYRPGNYYAQLADIQTFLVRRVSRFFRVDHSYPLFEATFCVFTKEHARGMYPAAEFQKYFGKP